MGLIQIGIQRNLQKENFEVCSEVLDQIVKKTPAKQPSGEQHPVEQFPAVQALNEKKINNFSASKHTLVIFTM